MTPTILILITLAAVTVLAGVAFVVMGKGGQLARFEADHPPLDLPVDRPVTSDDIARVTLPLALWGYHVRAVDEALARLATSLRERDTRIAELEYRMAELETSSDPRVLYPHSAGSGRHERPKDTDADAALPEQRSVRAGAATAEGAPETQPRPQDT
ncbi:hypothetical protein [Allosalinactinospora lopnorensis]|uniref:hypothetical protein n=1 Tax=Allosalinactinospora lopnorensis TaxID=1352348 RepID=UPI000698E943|nr:hypothetical protein [Allosalinactinospora lopnorensis]